MFFLVSGFVIPFALERRTMGGFALRRFFRFYPTLWAALALSILFVTLKAGAFPFDWGQVTSNGVLMSQYAGHSWVDGSYWTLPIEELFYVTAAILAVRGLLKNRTGILGAGIVLCVVGTFLGRQAVPSAQNPPDWLFWTRMWLGRNMIFVIFVLIGVGLHHLYRGGWSRRDFILITGALIGLFAIGLHNGPFQEPFQPIDQAHVYFNSYLVGLCVFLIAYLIGDHITHAKWADNLASMSYPIYLLNTVCGWILLVTIIEATGNYYLALVLTTAAVLLMAWLMHRFVEVPSMGIGRRISDRRRFVNAREMYPRRSREQPAPQPVETQTVVAPAATATATATAASDVVESGDVPTPPAAGALDVENALRSSSAQSRSRSARSWSDDPKARRRRRARRRPGYVPELDPDRAPEGLPDPASAMLGIDPPVADGNGRTPLASSDGDQSGSGFPHP